MSEQAEVIEQSQEIALHPASQEDAVMGMLQKALDKGVDADSLEKLLNMQERILDRQAEQAYAMSMMNVQRRMPKIHKNRTNDQTRSAYANLEIIISKVTPVYTEEGFSLSFGTADSPLSDCVRVTLDVMHCDGHSKHYFYDSPVDMHGIKGNQNKTRAHGAGSAVAYGRRYLTAMVFNLNTGDDDDGNAATEMEYINESQLGVLRDLMSSTGTKEADFCKFCKVESLELMPIAKYAHAHNALKTKQQDSLK